MWKYVPGLPVLLLLLSASACTDLPARPRPRPAHEVTITAGDFSFRAPDSIPAGLTRIRLFNEGPERHHAQLARLNGGRTMAELRDSLSRSRDLPSWVTFVGGPNVPVPGGPSDVLVSLEAGPRVMLVENRGPQPHEAIFVRLAPGKSTLDLMEWIKKKEGPPPGETYGGVMALQRGQVNLLQAEFTPGDYVLLCYVPDSGDGKPHVAHGMVRQITVE